MEVWAVVQVDSSEEQLPMESPKASPSPERQQPQSPRLAEVWSAERWAKQSAPQGAA